MHFVKPYLGAVLGLLLSAPILPAQPLPASGVTAGASKLTRRIMTGDRLRITVVEAPEMSKDYAVTGDGSIEMSMIGRVEIADLTAGEAAAKIAGLLEKDYFKKATVMVEVAAYVEGNIIMMGEVVRPGSIPFKGGEILTLVEAIAQSGGLGPRAAGKEVRIVRWKPGAGMERQVLTVDVQTMMQTLDFTRDQFLRPRDMVIVPSLGEGQGAGEYLVLGEVHGAGFRSYSKGLDIIRAISAVGGFTPAANLSNTRLLRPDSRGGYYVIPVDLARLFNGADMKQNVPVLAGDILFIPSLNQSSSGRVYLLGEVAQPGAYPLPLDANATLARTILAYGNIPKFADGKRVKLLRFAPDGTKQTMIVDVENILKNGSFENDVPLKNEDVVIVPAAGILPF
jgi:polysaccharide biosynthesis/export protein